MDKLLKIFKNQWVKIGVSVLSLGYGAFLLFVAWLAFAYVLKPTNGTSLFALYLFINVIFGAIMIYTRKQLITQIVACLAHPIIFVALIFGFGNWFLIIPPFVVATIVFFACGSSEALKTILGTIYMIMFVVGVLIYITLQTFSIKFTEVDLKLRCASTDYLYSTEETYRLVSYTDDESKEQRTISYYIEDATSDLHLWFLDCERFYGSTHILTSRYDKKPVIQWVTDDKLVIDGKIKAISSDYTDEDEEYNEDSDISGASGDKDTAVTTAVTTKAGADDGDIAAA